MSGLRKFLKRREEGIARQKAIRNEIHSEDIVPNKIEEFEDLTDSEFWEISNQFMQNCKNSDRSEVMILQNILEKYPDRKIKQFVERYRELNR